MWKTSIWTEWHQYPPDGRLEPITYWVVVCDKALATVLTEGRFTPIPGVRPVSKPVEDGQWRVEWRTYTVPTEEKYQQFQEAIAGVALELEKFRVYLRAVSEESSAR